ncbi:VOC family protein [Xenorhabdus griffiniae]|uniref:VOC family protein n=1 Tax=Xenorhabdus griffiniae TaxID=351672 RepID=A0ABY9XF78_9GAMM|nr:VOC family protein [Xenorhabdus griffiniae]MBD1228234.1 VOC family protein [Xenorhabdus griffiniae]MBE8587810.1 VOC family protein [Xenorhabdus griffiniae]WMV71500.1 VOC family protein [Xenorhabdus griffiniae]WNH01177.1 VOC family protein [Xenorhabdus griffiniae]
MKKTAVKELRLVVMTENFDEALSFYRDTLGLNEISSVPPDNGKVAILEAGRATLELVEPDTAHYIDRIEVGRKASGWIRVAFEVDDVIQTTSDLQKAGAEIIGPPCQTPFHSINSRLEAPAGLQLTLFQRN